MADCILASLQIYCDTFSHKYALACVPFVVYISNSILLRLDNVMTFSVRIEWDEVKPSNHEAMRVFRSWHRIRIQMQTTSFVTKVVSYSTSLWVIFWALVCSLSHYHLTLYDVCWYQSIAPPAAGQSDCCNNTTALIHQINDAVYSVWSVFDCTAIPFELTDTFSSTALLADSLASSSRIAFCFRYLYVSYFLRS